MNMSTLFRSKGKRFYSIYLYILLEANLFCMDVLLYAEILRFIISDDSYFFLKCSCERIKMPNRNLNFNKRNTKSPQDIKMSLYILFINVNL